MFEEKQMLISSMTKLITHLSSSKLHQLEIYKNLSRQDIQKIISNFEDSNPLIRSTSAQLLCQLLYNNSEVKSRFMSDMGIQPPSGNIVLNKIPKTDNIGETLMLVKNAKVSGSNNLCWYMNADKRSLEFVKKGDVFDIDPSKCIFGIVYQKDTISQPLRFIQAGQRTTDNQKTIGLDPIHSRNRVDNNTMYLSGSNRQGVTSSRLYHDNLKPTFRNSVYQPTRREQTSFASIGVPQISQVKTSSHNQQQLINFQVKTAPNVHVPKTTRASTSFAQTLGITKTSRDHNNVTSPTNPSVPSVSYIRSLRTNPKNE